MPETAEHQLPTLNAFMPQESPTLHTTFRKTERLCSEKLIEKVFHTGRKMMVFPYSIHWKIVPSEALPSGSIAQVLIATSKKRFHHATDRNRVKRLTRECYRLHKPILYSYLESHGLSLIVAISYVHNEIYDFATLMHKFDKIIATLINNIERGLPPQDNNHQPCH